MFLGRFGAIICQSLLALVVNRWRHNIIVARWDGFDPMGKRIVPSKYGWSSKKVTLGAEIIQCAGLTVYPSMPTVRSHGNMCTFHANR
ncbi:pollen-specific protein C13-like [Iris pallida]|uniref:Pollen-specific protein C13-like n=1 Tax=Iris pallida TaxID=29817 RepID=A0AAX6EE03_IRIPA|nr:pollen-specific protein C13-like [Iris pallida]